MNLVIKSCSFWFRDHCSFYKDRLILDKVRYFAGGPKKKEPVVKEDEGEEEEEKEVFLTPYFGKEKHKKEKECGEEEKKRGRESKREGRKWRIKKATKKNP